MVCGWKKDVTLSENDENGDGATQTELVDKWMENPNPNSNQIEVVTNILVNILPNILANILANIFG